ncbi:type II toxin-antitoxin system CcdA family antitoxin [Sphingomonas sp. MMS24-J45]|uniref:type II toxin-antitoxin system CcdA family antitoxin n=1 Tax=Sphingomonas sp. MMS24-J45 TaxID=3238806 RepID=UPI00384DD997
MATRLSRGDQAPPVRRPTNVSLDTKLVETAKAYGINVSRACEEGLAKQVSDERSRRWQEENKEAIEAYNAWIEENGIPLAEYRMF